MRALVRRSRQQVQSNQNRFDTLMALVRRVDCQANTRNRRRHDEDVARDANAESLGSEVNACDAKRHSRDKGAAHAVEPRAAGGRNSSGRNWPRP
jgi:hypothetical protein